MFERMEISEYIYKGVVTPYYKKNTWAEANRTGLSRNKREEAASLNTQPTKDGIALKHSKRYVDCSKSA